MEKTNKEILVTIETTELTWEEKNPTNYIYRPCEAIFRLEKKLNRRR
jgi:hypothetical protein